MAERVRRTIDSLPAGWDAHRLGERIRNLLPELRERYGIDSVALFGSYVRNEQRPESDLDLLVTFSKTLSLFERVDLWDELEEDLGVRVDIADRDHLLPRIDRYILREALEV